MVDFIKAVEAVLARESGYVHHASDPGGRTKYGISQRQYLDLDIAELTEEEARTIYQRGYSFIIGCTDLIRKGRCWSADVMAELKVCRW